MQNACRSNLTEGEFNLVLHSGSCSLSWQRRCGCKSLITCLVAGVEGIKVKVEPGYNTHSCTCRGMLSPGSSSSLRRFQVPTGSVKMLPNNSTFGEKFICRPWISFKLEKRYLIVTFTFISKMVKYFSHFLYYFPAFYVSSFGTYSDHVSIFKLLPLCC